MLEVTENLTICMTEIDEAYRYLTLTDAEGHVDDMIDKWFSDGTINENEKARLIMHSFHCYKFYRSRERR